MCNEPAHADKPGKRNYVAKCAYGYDGEAQGHSYEDRGQTTQDNQHYEDPQNEEPLEYYEDQQNYVTSIPPHNPEHFDSNPERQHYY